MGLSRTVPRTLLLLKCFSLPSTTDRKRKQPAYLPCVEVEGGQLAKIAIRHVHIEALRLVDEGSPVCCHVYKLALLDLPHSLVQRLEAVWNVQILHVTCQPIKPCLAWWKYR